MPMDAAVTLPDGRTVAVVMQGLTANRTAFAKRLWRLREAFQPNAVLLLIPDEVRLRRARRLVSGSPSIAFLALESDAAFRQGERRIWRALSGPALRNLRTALAHTRPRGAWPTEEPPERASLPASINADDPAHDASYHMLPVMLKTTEKRALDLLSTGLG